MLFHSPRKTNFKKFQKRKLRVFMNSSRGCNLRYGSFGLKALKSFRLEPKQFEAAIKALTQSLKKNVRIWTRLHPDKSITKKPHETRMGKGKGPVSHWACPIMAGKVIFEIENVGLMLAARALKAASKMLSAPTAILFRR